MKAVAALMVIVALASGPVAATPGPMWAFVIVHLDFTAQVVWQNLANSQIGDYIVERSNSPTFASGVSTVAGVPTTLCLTCTDLTLTAQADADPINYNFRVQYNPGGTGVIAASNIITLPVTLNAGIFAFAYPAPYGSADNDCGTWAEPCLSIQKALDTPAANSYILVGPGTYTPATGNVEITFRGTSKTVHGMVGKDYTFLDLAYQGRGFLFQSGEQGAQLKGLTITRGASFLDASVGGAGIHILNSSPIISDVTITGCTTCYPTAGGGPPDGTTPCMGNGGAVYVGNTVNTSNPAAVTAQLLNVNMVMNAGGGGGGLAFSHSVVVLMDAYLDHNYALAPGQGVGGCILGDYSALVMQRVSMSNCMSMYAGGAMQLGGTLSYGLDGAPGPFQSISIVNCTTSSFGGAINLLIMSNVTFKDSIIDNNYSGSFGGNIMSVFAIFTLQDTVISRGTAGYFGGAVLMISSVVTITNTQVLNNTASLLFGGGFYVSRGGGIPTILSLSNSLVQGNVAKGAKGGGLQGTSFDAIILVNTTFNQNIAAHGGSILVSGDTTTTANQMTIAYSTFTENTAQQGAALYMEAGAFVSVSNSVFARNFGGNTGGAIAVGANATLAISGSLFQENGVSLCTGKGAEHPVSGGAIQIGVIDFRASTDMCSAVTVDPAWVSIDSTTLTANKAMEYGGAIAVQSGNLVLSNSLIQGNMVTSSSSVGGGLYVANFSGDGSPTAVLTNVTLDSNSATVAGGGLFYGAETPGSSLSIVGGTIIRNQVAHDLASSVKQGLGGGVFLQAGNFNLTGVAIAENSAKMGGGLFCSTDMASGTTFSVLSFSNNTASIGASIFWLRSKSPAAALECIGCNLGSAVDAVSYEDTAMATEVLSAVLNTTSLAMQSGQNAEVFKVQLEDYYGHVGTIEDMGSCTISAPHGIKDIVIPSDLMTAVLRGGNSTFSTFQIVGGVGREYDLVVSCQPSTAGQSSLLPASTPVLLATLHVSIGECQQGTYQQVDNLGYDTCKYCDRGRYNFDGLECKVCQKGGMCPGSVEGTATPIDTLAGYWRSSNTTDVPVYPCKVPSVCYGYDPLWNPLGGRDAGDALCATGYKGPLCAVCDTNYYNMNNNCRWCGNGSSGKAQVAGIMTALFIFLVIVFIFDIGGSGPGMMVKIKLLQNHLQVLSLINAYDVTLPSQAVSFMGWSNTINLGVSTTAPECYINGFNFYYLWVLTMALPALLMLITLGVFCGALLFGRWLNRYIPEQSRYLQKYVTPDRVTKAKQGLDNLHCRCYKNMFWLVSLVYPKCAQVALQFFSVDKLDLGWYLGSDYSIVVWPAGGHISRLYAAYMPFAILFLLIYTIGIPAFFSWLIWRCRKNYDEPRTLKKYGFLYGGYTWKYYQVQEMVRMLVLAMIPVFVPTRTTGSLQAVLGQLVLIAHMVLCLVIHPFEDNTDNLLQIVSSIVLWLVLVTGETLKWAQLNNKQMQYFSVALLLLMVGMAALCFFLILKRSPTVGKATEIIKRQVSTRLSAKVSDLETMMGARLSRASSMARPSAAATLRQIQLKAQDRQVSFAVTDLESGTVDEGQSPSKKSLLGGTASRSDAPPPEVELGETDTPRSTDGLLGDVKRMARQIEERSRGPSG